MISHPKSERFLSELSVARHVQSVAHQRGLQLELEQAHEVWAEHSEDMCAGWLLPDSESPEAEIAQALTKYQARHSHVVGSGAKCHRCGKPLPQCYPATLSWSCPDCALKAMSQIVQTALKV